MSLRWHQEVMIIALLLNVTVDNNQQWKAKQGLCTSKVKMHNTETEKHPAADFTAE